MWQTRLPMLYRDEPETADADHLHHTFVQNVSHELRTPLSIILGYVEMLYGGELGALTPEQQEAVLAIVNRAYELRALVERIGILLAVEARSGDSTPIALDKLVAEVVRARQPSATQAGLTLEAHLDPDVPFVLGDPYHLQPAIDCLVENALKFTPAGGRVEVRVYTDPGWVCLGVSDTGIGIAEQELERVLSGFYQIDSSATRRYRGVGLGLAVVRAVVEEHGGRVEVESQSGQGSRFIVKLPVLPPEAEATAAATQPVGGSAVLQRILVVDDEAHVAQTLQAGLESLPNCEVETAASGEQALHAFEQKPFDLLITDYKMPGTDGVTLATRIRQLYPRTVIVMITAYDNDVLREQAAGASVRCILDKPVGLGEIRNIVLKALEQPVGAHKSSHEGPGQEGVGTTCSRNAC